MNRAPSASCSTRATAAAPEGDKAATGCTSIQASCLGEGSGDPVLEPTDAGAMRPSHLRAVRWAGTVPRASAVLSMDDLDTQTPRDRHIRLMAEKGRIGWQRATGYGKRNHVETTIGRYKHLIDPRLCARTLPAQQREAAIAVAVLNRMIWAAKPVSLRRA